MICKCCDGTYFTETSYGDSVTCDECGWDNIFEHDFELCELIDATEFRREMREAGERDAMERNRIHAMNDLFDGVARARMQRVGY